MAYRAKNIYYLAFYEKMFADLWFKMTEKVILTRVLNNPVES